MTKSSTLAEIIEARRWAAQTMSVGDEVRCWRCYRHVYRVQEGGQLTCLDCSLRYQLLPLTQAATFTRPWCLTCLCRSQWKVWSGVVTCVRCRGSRPYIAATELVLLTDQPTQRQLEQALMVIDGKPSWDRTRVVGRASSKRARARQRRFDLKKLEQGLDPTIDYRTWLGRSQKKFLTRKLQTCEDDGRFRKIRRMQP